MGDDGPQAVAARARALIERARGRDELFLSMFSIWELAKKVEKGQLAFDRPLDDWLNRHWPLTACRSPKSPGRC